MQHSAGNSPTNTEPLHNSPKGDTPSDESVDTTILGTPISYKVLELNSVEGSDDAEKTVAVAMKDDEKEKPLVELFGRKRKASSEMQKKVVSPPKRHTLRLMPQEEGEGSKKRMKGDERSEAVIQGLLDLNQEVEEKENSDDDVFLEAIVVPFADLMEDYEAEPSVEEEGEVEEEGSEVESYADEDEEVEPSDEEEGSEVESYADEDNEVNPSAENSVENEVEDHEEETTEVKPSAVVESEEEPHAEKDDEVKLSAVDTNEVEPSAADKVEYDQGQASGANKDEGESSHAHEKKAKGGFKFDLNELPPEEEDEN